MFYPIVRNSVVFKRFKLIEILDLNPGRKFVEDLTINERFLRFIGRYGDDRLDESVKERLFIELQIVNSLHLDGIGDDRFYVKPLKSMNKWLYLNSLDSLLVIRETNYLGLCISGGDLLEELHSKIESSRDASASFKLALKIIKKVEYTRYLPKDRLFLFMEKYFELLTNSISSYWIEALTKLALDVFECFSLRDDVCYEFFKTSNYLCFVLMSAQLHGKPMKGLWQESVLAQEITISNFFSANIINFAPLIIFGVKPFYFYALYKKLKEWIIILFETHLNTDDKRKFVQLLNSSHKRRTKFRVLQVSYLWHRTLVSARPEQFEEVVKVVWRSIPEPFLTIDDFHLLVEDISNDDLLSHLLNSCAWYKTQINMQHVPSGPRSLKFLSRCAVHSRLGSCRQLPIGINSLREPILPRTLHQYLENYSQNLTDFC